MINVFIVDDHKIVIEGLILILQDDPNINIVGTALSGEEALETITNFEVDIVLLDINMPNLNGIETCKNLIKQNSSLKIIGISMHKESSLIKLMLKNGAMGYVLKNAGREEVLNAINTVYKGKTYLDSDANEIIVNSITQSKKEKTSPFPTLSNREKDVLRCILDELTTQETADKLFISFGTVETHRRNILIKTGSRNTAGLVKTAIEYNLV